ncbi:MAG: MFS transporter [Fusobacteriia bacterium 4572_74]|nr:MAG: MFS transporter [Fusobacteriia bacterium 4572_74]
MKKEMKIYFYILAFTALAKGMSQGIFSNYFKDAYNITAFQRGIIEFPREIPGMIGILVIAFLASMNDIRVSIFAQILSISGIFILGIFTPKFSVMLVFLFINSLGAHVFMPLSDGIAISLVERNKLGMRMGQFKGTSTAFLMLSSTIVFICFKLNIFSFVTTIKWPFILAGIFSLVVLGLLILLDRIMHHPVIHHKKTKFIFRKEYKFYYILVILFGAQKQIMLVYGPWVLIEILGKKADTLALLTIAGSFVGIFFIPALGRWLDRFGVKKLLYADGISFVVVYFLFGLLTTGYVTGTLSTVGWPVLLGYFMVIIDKISTQMSFIRTVYLKNIAVNSSDVIPTLSLGMSMDHFVSITCAILSGLVWSFWGPQYIFYFAAIISLGNIYVAHKVKL